MRKLKANVFLESLQIPGFLLEFIYKYTYIYKLYIYKCTHKYKFNNTLLKKI